MYLSIHAVFLLFLYSAFPRQSNVVSNTIICCVCFVVFVLSYTSLLSQVLFEELHLDSLYGKTLSKTQVNKLKSTSEAVVRMTYVVW